MTDDVHELMAQAMELPYGEARTVLVENALRRAEGLGDPELEFEIRLELTEAYQYGGEAAKMFTSFSRCLADFDRDPGRLPELAEYHLLWQFKWVINSLTDFPEVALDRTYALLDDMERRYRQGGHSPYAVYTCRENVARHLGDPDAADAWYARWQAAPRDQLSDCAGCDPTSKVGHLTWRGRDEEAIAMAAPVLSQELTCREQPQMILTALLPVYLRTGRADEARDAHRRAYRVIRTALADLESIAEHIEFCARSANAARGLEIVGRHLDWLDRAPSPYAAMRFAAASALVLRILEDTGHGDAVVRGDRTAAALRPELEARALEIAARFDARNRTPHQGDQVRATLAAEPLDDPLPLSAHTRPPAPAPVPPPAATDDPVELLDAAEEHWHRHETAAALAAWHRFDELAGERGGDAASLAGRRADGLGYELFIRDDAEGALREWERAARLHAEAGDVERQHSALGRAGSMMIQLGRAEAGLTRVMEAADRLPPDSRRGVAARLRLAAAHLEAGRAPEALVVLDGLAPSELGESAQVDLMRARVLTALERSEDATAQARRACDGLRAAGLTGALLADAAMLLGHLLAADPEDESAEAAFTEAVSEAPAYPQALRPAAYGSRGAWLLAQGRCAEAASDLVEAVAGFTACGNHGQAARARQELCAVYYNIGRYLEAAEVAEEAVATFVRLGDEGGADSCRFVLAHAQRQLGETEQAADVFTELARSGAEDDPGQSAELLEQAAELLGGLDKDLLAAERLAAAAELYTSADRPIAAVAARRRLAVCLLYTGRAAEARTVVETACTQLAEAPSGEEADWEAAALAYDEARILDALDDLRGACERARQAEEGFRALGAEDALRVAANLRSDLEVSLGEEPTD